MAAGGLRLEFRDVRGDIRKTIPGRTDQRAIQENTAGVASPGEEIEMKPVVARRHRERRRDVSIAALPPDLAPRGGTSYRPHVIVPELSNEALRESTPFGSNTVTFMSLKMPLPR
jgi:hypothetical protein